MYYELVKKLCDERGISIAKLEKEAEIGNGTVGGWKEFTPSLKTLTKVAQYFGIPVADLISQEPEQ